MSLRSVAVPTHLNGELIAHLDRLDGQEDLCFALYRTSTGANRTTAVLFELVLPEEGEREVHGNVAFTTDYFLRAADLASEHDAGLVLLHSHPGGQSWQDMSRDDIAAESGFAAQASVLVGHPFVGMTLATGDMAWSGRFWLGTGSEYVRTECESVRVVGEALRVSRPRGVSRSMTYENRVRTVSVWGEKVQQEFADLRIGIVGLGSVGSMVAEALARTGAGNLVLIDFDSIKLHNLDRVIGATKRDVLLAKSKVATSQAALLRSATNDEIRVDDVEMSLAEPAGWQAALDCDVLFSCVDRPWARHLLNLAAYAHLIPFIDGGILAEADSEQNMITAEWRVQTIAPGRRCLQCHRQYDAADVSLERNGLLDDPAYIKGLASNHPLRARSNVFAFSMNVASLEVLQLISMLAAPRGIADLGGQSYNAIMGTLDIDERDCEPGCPYNLDILALGDQAAALLGRHHEAEAERAERLRLSRKWTVRLGRFAEKFANRWLLRES